jgi:proteasome lid subunit RPN8/RPN11
MKTLLIPKELLDEMVAHCKEAYPLEACGILAGKNRAVRKIYKITNIERSSISYFMESREQFRAMKEMRDLALEMLAIYHSHPYSDAYPSTRDVSHAFYQDSLYVIISLIYEDPLVKVFEIKDNVVTEIPMYV